jgi:hypothetical protein
MSKTWLFPDNNVGRTLLVDPDGTVYGVKQTSNVPHVNIEGSALPSGAATESTLGDIKTAVQIMDDWDDTDKCKVQSRDQFGWSADCTPNSELITTDKIRIVGAIFNGGTVDSNFWTAATHVNGTLTQVANSLVLTSAAAQNDYAGVYSVRRATWVTGTSQKFRSQMRLEDLTATNLVRRWGVGWAATMTSTAITDGACFKLTGTALSIVTFANSTSGTEVASANFNGTYSAPTLTNMTTYEILYTLGKVYFIIGGVIVHTVTASTAHWTTNTVNFHIFADVKTTGGAGVAKAMYFRMMNISRLGSFMTQPTYKYISGNAATYVLKLGGGLLHNIVFNNTTGTSLTIYDAVDAVTAGTTVAIITTATTSQGTWNYEMPFFNGLTVKTIGNGLDATIIYE